MNYRLVVKGANPDFSSYLLGRFAMWGLVQQQAVQGDVQLLGKLNELFNLRVPFAQFPL